jgi:hypothetical protein
MPPLRHELEPLTIRDHAVYPGYYRFSIVTRSGSGHLADVACYDLHPDDDPVGVDGASRRQLDLRAWGHAVLFVNAVRMFVLLRRLLSYIPPTGDLPEAVTAAEARELLSEMEAEPGFAPAAWAADTASLADAGAEVAGVLRDLLESLPPIDPESQFHGDFQGLSRATLIEVLSEIGPAARAAVDQWEGAGGAFTAAGGDGTVGG